MISKLIRKLKLFLALKKENISLKKQVGLLEEQLKNKKIEDENIYYQRWIAVSLALEGKTGDFKVDKKCPLCHLDRRLYAIPSNVLDFLIKNEKSQA